MASAAERPSRARVVVVGGRDPLSERLLGALAASGGVAAAAAVDGPGELERLLAAGGSDTLVYLGGVRGRRGAPDAEDAAACFAAAAGRVRCAVVVGSATAYEPSHHHPGQAGEEVEPRFGRNPLPGRWRALERLAREALDGDGTALALLRPAPVPVPGGDDPWSRLFAGRVAATVPGYDPTIQVLGADDLARAVCRAVEGRARGVFNLVPAAAIPLHAALRTAGVRRLPVPLWLQWLGRKGLAAAGLGAGAEEIDYRRYSWTAGGRRARDELGFEARQSSAEVLAGLAAARGRRPPAHAAGPTAAEFDDFGLDPGYIAARWRFPFSLLHRLYWRIEVQGAEAVPREGRAVLVGVHRGFMPFDGVMALYTVLHARGRVPRFLIHPTLVKFPFLSNLMTKLGGLHACRDNADWVLGREGLLGIYPEGIRGAFTPYRRAYRLGKFGRDEYVKMALRNRAPLIPFVTVGSAEIFPILARIRWRWWMRYSEWPCFPITPTFPLLPLPLPSKWHTRFLPPMHVERRYSPADADDPEVVKAISRDVRSRMREAFADMLGRRRSIFYGSIFQGEAA